MCMILCNHDDHNVITTSLETLVQLLSSPVEQVVQRLTSHSGIQNSIDGDAWESKLHESQISSSKLKFTYLQNTQVVLHYLCLFHRHVQFSVFRCDKST